MLNKQIKEAELKAEEVERIKREKREQMFKVIEYSRQLKEQIKERESKCTYRFGEVSCGVPQEGVPAVLGRAREGTGEDRGERGRADAEAAKAASGLLDSSDG